MSFLRKRFLIKTSLKIFIFISLLIILNIVFFYKTFKHKEAFSANNIVLMGDSILNNEAYVGRRDTVKSKLLQHNNNRVFMFAKDHSMVYDAFTQLGEIPYYLNNSDTTIILSVGGNNILTKHLYSDKNKSFFSKNEDFGETHLRIIFDDYEHLIFTIRKNMHKAILYLMDIYYPQSNEFDKYAKYIGYWNRMLYKFAAEQNIYVIKISESVKHSNDFTNGIEPSSVGATIIASQILNRLNS